MYSKYNLEVFVDLSTYCNAGCPQCHRTNPDTLQKVDWLPLLQWSLDDFKRAFPISLLKADPVPIIRCFSICGTWGDPIMNKDIKEIIEYIAKNSHDELKIVVDTNASIRDEQWWWEFGMIGGKKLHVTFDIDGINQEMHETYRVNSNLQKVLNNMKALSETHATARAQTILFKHNQDYINEIKELATKYGANDCLFVQSDRFHETTTRYYNNGKIKLEKATLSPPNAFITYTNTTKLEEKIECRWKKANKIVVNIDGSVLPCCYFVNGYYERKLTNNNNKRHDRFINHPIMKDYIENKNEMNIFNTSLLDIIENSTWFNKTLPNSWNSDNPVFSCSKWCSSKIKKTHQLKGVL